MEKSCTGLVLKEPYQIKISSWGFAKLNTLRQTGNNNCLKFSET